jgi:hypothetical protein
MGGETSVRGEVWKKHAERFHRQVSNRDPCAGAPLEMGNPAPAKPLEDWERRLYETTRKNEAQQARARWNNDRVYRSAPGDLLPKTGKWATKNTKKKPASAKQAEYLSDLMRKAGERPMSDGERKRLTQDVVSKQIARLLAKKAQR